MYHTAKPASKAPNEKLLGHKSTGLIVLLAVQNATWLLQFLYRKVKIEVDGARDD